ncbi:DoxX family protein [Pseudoalteromonas sp. C2R02]|uniref:DoxX family protein n=1 Tax=Pseudoalteromonas sp. C2R02 TaxID=2841565 RepID=UPI001C0952E5|nr:DoxX family protein [Pseudoalteromonas sp. C2R02]MBU2971683.1 DoxX family protein [Pseudoalteromonas sp. C2R02]
MSLSTIKQLIQNIASSKSGLDTLALRFGAGAIFFAHGAQKLFAWFGGYGLEGTGGWMESIGITPGVLMATMAGSAEFFGGIFLMLGLLVRPTSIVLAITMLVAIFSVHINNGLFMSNNGYEFALALLIISISLVFRGAGSLSLDKLVTKKLGA